MARFLFTMLPANDLGLPTRLVRIARMLADRGHEVALFNPAPAPAHLIADARLKNLPMPAPGIPAGEIVLPTDAADGEKHIEVGEFRTKVRNVLSEPAYRRAARRVADSMSKLGGAQEAAQRIERLALGRN
jgi:UDP:flavonoid glycosyltransferase YjiC (YdhE family)